MNQQILIDKGGSIEYKYFEYSIQKIPTALSAKITIYDSSGTEKVAETLMTIDSEGTMTYLIPSVLCDDVYYNWKADIKFTVGNIVKYAVILFDIVRYIIVNPVIDKDIIDRAPFIKDMNYRRIELANSGTVNTIVCNELLEEDGYWTSGKVEIIEGKNEGTERLIIVFANKVITVKDNYQQAINITSKFVITRSFQKELNQAFDKFQVDLFNQGIKINDIIDNKQTKEYIILLTLYFICWNFSKDVVDIWYEKAKEYKKEYDKMIGKAVFNYDSSGDGNIDSSEVQDNVGQIEAQR